MDTVSTVSPILSPVLSTTLSILSPNVSVFLTEWFRFFLFLISLFYVSALLYFLVFKRSLRILSHPFFLTAILLLGFLTRLWIVLFWNNGYQQNQDFFLSFLFSFLLPQWIFDTWLTNNLLSPFSVFVLEALCILFLVLFSRTESEQNQEKKATKKIQPKEWLWILLIFWNPWWIVHLYGTIPNNAGNPFSSLFAGFFILVSFYLGLRAKNSKILSSTLSSSRSSLSSRLFTNKKNLFRIRSFFLRSFSAIVFGLGIGLQPILVLTLPFLLRFLGLFLSISLLVWIGFFLFSTDYLEYFLLRVLESNSLQEFLSFFFPIENSSNDYSSSFYSILRSIWTSLNWNFSNWNSLNWDNFYKSFVVALWILVLVQGIFSRRESLSKLHWAGVILLWTHMDFLSASFPFFLLLSTLVQEPFFMLYSLYFLLQNWFGFLPQYVDRIVFLVLACFFFYRHFFYGNFMNRRKSRNEKP